MIPNEIGQLCGAEEFIVRAKEQVEKEKGDGVKAVEKEYIAHAHAIDAEFQVKFKEFFQSGTSPDTSDAALKRAYFDVLQRYSPTGHNLCTMLFTHGQYIPSMYAQLSDRLQIFAPYSCRYAIYNSLEVRTCRCSFGAFGVNCAAFDLMRCAVDTVCVHDVAERPVPRCVYRHLARRAPRSVPRRLHDA